MRDYARKQSTLNVDWHFFLKFIQKKMCKKVHWDEHQRIVCSFKHSPFVSCFEILFLKYGLLLQLHRQEAYFLNRFCIAMFFISLNKV